MNVITKKLLNKVAVATICLFGLQAESVFADDPCGCGAALNLCETIAANNYNTCLNNCNANAVECAALCPVGCIIAGPFYPACLAACELACTAVSATCYNTCGNTYDSDIANCNAEYAACRAPENCH